MNVSPLATISNHLRSKYHNCPLYIVHCPSAQQRDKLEFEQMETVLRGFLSGPFFLYLFQFHGAGGKILHRVAHLDASAHQQAAGVALAGGNIFIYSIRV